MLSLFSTQSVKSFTKNTWTVASLFPQKDSTSSCHMFELPAEQTLLQLDLERVGRTAAIESSLSWRNYQNGTWYFVA